LETKGKGKMATLQTVIGVYISPGEGLKDFYERVPVSTKSTVLDVVKTLVKKLFGSEDPAKYALYEIEYSKGSNDVLYVAIDDHAAQTDEDLMFLKGELITVTKKISDSVWEGECEGISGLFPPKLVKPAQAEGHTDASTSRKVVRLLRDTEIPLFVQYNWKYTKNTNLNFLLKERDIEIRENATKDFYIGMSKAKLEGLLESLQAQEEQAANAIKAKYDKQAEQYLKALQDAKAHRGK